MMLDWDLTCETQVCVVVIFSYFATSLGCPNQENSLSIRTSIGMLFDGQTLVTQVSKMAMLVSLKPYS